MKTYCVLLRGINIGTKRIGMDQLRQAFLQMGFAAVQTKLATGNVIASAPDDGKTREERKAEIERELGRRFGYDAHVLLRDMAEIEQICASSEAIRVPDECHLYFLFCDDKGIIGELTARFEVCVHAPNEQWIAHEQGAFWIVPKGMTLQSKFGGRVLGSAKYKSALTSRNMNTVRGLCRQMHSNG